MRDVWRELRDWEFGPLAVIMLAAVVTLVAVEVAYWALRRAGRRLPVLAAGVSRSHRPARLLAVLVAVRLAVAATTTTGAWRGWLLQLLLLAIIGAAGWLVTALLLVLEDAALARFRTDVPDNLDARRVHTQVSILRRVTVVILSVLTIGVALTTFPAVRTLGASVLASAGLAGVIAGLAAQSLLGNLFAGLQLAFSDALRLDDVVVVEGEWGRIEELTITYVVVRIWDQRRLILPTSYFTTKPFENWTRSDAEILGTVLVDVDWTVPVAGVRAELERFVVDNPLWDGRQATLQVTDATGGTVRLRAVVSAASGPGAWELRCAVREHLVEWVRRHQPGALPRVRAEVAASLRGADG